MSWMDSWSRPTKSSSTLPPLYITNPSTKYCRSCGRVISDRKSHQKSASKGVNKDGEPANVIKYCSDGCRKRRVGPLDKKIDRAILALLEGQAGSGIENIDVKSRTRKGDHRNLISTDEIEQIVFDRNDAPEEKKLDESEAEEQPDPYEVVDEEALNSQGNRPNPDGAGSAEKQREGQKRSDEREAVRRAARRAVVFGFAAATSALVDKPGDLDDLSERKCEAIMNGQVVEPSYAKGNWFIRWRE